MTTKFNADEARALVDRLTDGSDRFLKSAHGEQYSGPPVVSIPRHRDNIDLLLIEAADTLTAALDRIEALEADLREADDRANLFATKEMHTEKRANKAEAERDTAWNDAIEAAAECVGHITQSEDRDAILTLKKGDTP